MAKRKPDVPDADRLAARQPETDNSGNASSVRIVAARDETETTPAQPVAASVSPPDVPRLRITAGSPSNRFATKPIETPPDGDAPRRLSVAPDVKLLAVAPDADQTAEGQKGVVQAVWNEPATAATSPTVKAAGFASADDGKPYGYEPSYAALRGRLEYSAGARQWKLRYIPIDGTTDQFGGSVVLNDSARLEGFHTGDFVSVEGSLAAGAKGARTFSPGYELTQIAPLR